jgi:hypothetical protein
MRRFGVFILGPSILAILLFINKADAATQCQIPKTFRWSRLETGTPKTIRILKAARMQVQNCITVSAGAVPPPSTSTNNSGPRSRTVFSPPLPRLL